MARFGIFILWLLHFLPLAVLAWIGSAIGMLFYALGRERRSVVLTNLRLCFPEKPEAERADLARRHFRAFGRSVIDHAVLWWGSKERVQRMARIEGIEHWLAVRERPVIWLAPHFVGLVMGGVRLSMDHRLTTLYRPAKNPVIDRMMLLGRSRFLSPVLISKSDGIKPVLKGLKDGLPFYYLPDQDQGRHNAVFVPFFGIPAAAISALPRLAKLTGAQIVPVTTRQLPGGRGYRVRFYPPWDNFPSDDLEADVARMNAFIEDRVREMPTQYLWLHRRFKTRPQGEPSLYE